MSNTRRGLTVGVLAATAVFGLVGCGSSGKQAGPTTAAGVAPTTGPATTVAPSAGSNTTGVTPTTITVGTVADLSGPVPGLFKSASDTMQAFAAYVNSTGGIDGRQLKVVVKDSALNCNVNKNVTQQLASSVFAIVGSFSSNDGCAIPVLQANPGLPDVSFTLDPRLYSVPNVYSVQPGPPGFTTTNYDYFKQKYPNAVTKVGWLYSATDSFDFEEQQAASESVGYKTIYSRGVGPTETQFTSDILRMKADGVQFLDLQDVTAPVIAEVVSAAQQQSWHPEVIYAPVAYDAQFFTTATPAEAQGVYADQQFAMFLGEDSKSVPEVANFLTWLKKTHPGDRPQLFGAFAWASGLLFEQAMKAAGPNPTRSSLLAALKNIHNFDANGFIAPADVGDKKPAVCIVVIQINKGKYDRVAPPGKGFYCKGGFYYTQSSKTGGN